MNHTQADTHVFDRAVLQGARRSALSNAEGDSDRIQAISETLGD